MAPNVATIQPGTLMLPRSSCRTGGFTKTGLFRESRAKCRWGREVYGELVGSKSESPAGFDSTTLSSSGKVKAWLQ